VHLVVLNKFHAPNEGTEYGTHQTALKCCLT